MDDTPSKLKQAAVTTLVERGIAGTSARTIAQAAGVSQGLVFYHFDSVTGLLAAATGEMAARRAADNRRQLAGIDSLTGLAELARQLHEQEQQARNVTVMAQLLAGAQTNPELAPIARTNYQLLADEVHAALDRLLADHPVAGELPAAALADLVSATFIGVQLLPDQEHTQEVEPLFDALVELAEIVDAFRDAGPVVTAALRRLRSR